MEKFLLKLNSRPKIITWKTMSFGNSTNQSPFVGIVDRGTIVFENIRKCGLSAYLFLDDLFAELMDSK